VYTLGQSYLLQWDMMMAGSFKGKHISDPSAVVIQTQPGFATGTGAGTDPELKKALQAASEGK